VTNCRPIARVAAHVAAAEELGVGRAFIAEDIGCRDAFQCAVVSARRTRSIDLTIGVTNPYLRSPKSLAESLLTVNQLTARRTTLGLGSSAASIISGQLGLEYGKPISVMRDVVANLRHEAGLMDPTFKPGITLAAMGPQMLRLAGEIADEVILNTGSTPDYVRWAAKEIAAGSARVGRSLEATNIAVWITAYLDSDPDDALRRARRWTARMLSMPRQGELLLDHADRNGALDRSLLTELRSICGVYPESGDIDHGASLVPEDIVRALTIVGPVDLALRRLDAYLDAGARALILGPGALATVAHTLKVPRKVPGSRSPCD
jgi:5,10-methylenetetrahydromethanopterin reductase